MPVIEAMFRTEGEGTTKKNNNYSCLQRLLFSDPAYALNNGRHEDGLTAVLIAPRARIRNLEDCQGRNLSCRLQDSGQYQFRVCPDRFREADRFCSQIYQQYGLLEKGMLFGSTPDLYLALYRHNEIVATLAYKFSKVSVKKIYRFDFSDHVTEVMRFAVDPRVKKRVEIQTENRIKGVGDEAPWITYRKFQKFCFGMVDLRMEIGQRLFACLTELYNCLFAGYDSNELPAIKINTYKNVISFFDSNLKSNIFRREEGAVLCQNHIDEQSRLAYEKHGFRLYSIRKECVWPDRFRS